MKKQEKIEQKRATRLNGTVTSDKMQGTVVVTVSRATRHPLYKKTVVKSKKYKADNQIGAAMGDSVRIEETRPMSKDKRFKVIQIFEKALVEVPILEEESDLDLLLNLDGDKKEA